MRNRIAAVGAPADRNRPGTRPVPCEESRPRRAVRATELSTGSCGARDAERTAEEARPGAGRTETALVATGPCSVTTPETRPAEVSMPRTAVRLTMRAPAPGAAGDRGRRASGLGARVARRVRARATRPSAEHGRRVPRPVGGGCRARARAPRQPLGERRRAAPRPPRDTACRPGGIRCLRRRRRQRLPEARLSHHERQFDRRAALLAHPAPVTSRLFAGRCGLSRTRRPRRTACEKVRRRAADDAAANDGDVHGLGQRVAVACQANSSSRRDEPGARLTSGRPFAHPHPVECANVRPGTAIR